MILGTSFVMLAIAVEDDEHIHVIRSGLVEEGFQCGPVSEVRTMADHGGTGGFSDACGVIGGPIVDAHHLIRVASGELDDRPDRLLLIEHRHPDHDAIGSISHAPGALRTDYEGMQGTGPSCGVSRSVSQLGDRGHGVGR